MLLPFHLKNELNQRRQLVSYLNLIDMAEPTHIPILHLNLFYGFLPNSNCIL